MARAVTKRIGLYDRPTVMRLPLRLRVGWVFISIFMPPVYSAPEVVLEILKSNMALLFYPGNSPISQILSRLHYLFYARISGSSPTVVSFLFWAGTTSCRIHFCVCARLGKHFMFEVIWIVSCHIEGQQLALLFTTTKRENCSDTIRDKKIRNR